MSESTKEEVVDVEVVPETVSTVSAPASASKAKKKIPALGIAVGAVIVAAVILQGSGVVDVRSVFVKNEAERAVATVNGARITRAELNTRLKEVQGPSVDPAAPVDAAQERQVLEQLVDLKLLMDVAAASSLTASEEEIAKEIDTLITTFGSQEKLDEQLVAAGITMERLRSNIRDEIVLRKVVEANTDSASITITDEEVKKVYDAEIAGTEGAPSYEELVPFIRDQLKQQQVAAKAQEYLATLRAGAKIEILI